MQLYVDHEHFTGYLTCVKRKKIARKDFVKLCLQESATGDVDFLAVVTTCVGKKLFNPLLPFAGRSLYFMGLDCDDLQSALAAINYLEKHNIGWARIESSQDHYWIITDYIDTAPKVIDRMKYIAGVDKKFIEVCEKHNSCQFRASPRLNKIPNFESYEIHGITDQRVLNWLEEYRILLNDIRESFDNLNTRAAIDNDEYFTLMAKPGE